MNTNEPKDIKIPIKALVELSVKKNHCNYETDTDEFNLLRKYFIACLNLGFISKPKHLPELIDKFTSKIKSINLDYNLLNKLDHYKIVDSTLYINGELKFHASDVYEKNFYKAVSEVIWESNEEHIGFSNALSNSAAEKVYHMDTTGLRIIMPKTVTEQIDKEEIQIRAGYENYNLPISLLKKFFISRGINENIVIKYMFYKGYTDVYKDVIVGGGNEFFMEILDKLCLMYISRSAANQTHPKEKVLLDKYQLMCNDNFVESSQNWFAFLALCTTDELRQKCMKKFELE